MKLLKRITSLFLGLLMILSFGASSLVYADEVGQGLVDKDMYKDWGKPVVQIDNGVIRVTADKQTGRFITETLSGLPNKSSDDYKDLLYGNRFESPETSYTSVRIDGEDFIYGNNYGLLGLEGNYTTVPYVDVETNSIVSEWSIKDVVVTQRLTLTKNPKLDSIGSVYVSYDIVNKGDKLKKVGVRTLFDTKVGTVDSPALTVPGDGFIYKEKEYIGDEIPSIWYAYEQYVSPQVIALGAVSGEGLSKPDKLQFAAWGDVSQTKWDYTVDINKPIIQVTIDGKPYDGANGKYPDNAVVDYAVKDSCAVMYWNPVELKKGETKSIDTAYGVGDASEKDSDPGYRIGLQGTDKLNMKQDRTGYTIDYVNAEFNIDNNFDNSKNIANLQIEIELPDELELVEGDKKTVIKEFSKGTYQRSMWKLRPKVQDKFTISAYSVLLRAEGMPAQRITKTLIMEGKEGKIPPITFLDSTPDIPFYVEDINRSVFVSGSGFGTFGNSINQVLEAKLQQGGKIYKIDSSTFKKLSDTVISVGVPDGVPVGTYDLFVSVADATGNNNDKKTLKNAVVISDDIKYSLNLVEQVKLPIVMKDDGNNTPTEFATIYGKFIDNKNGTYTSLGASVKNPVRINDSLKFANGTLTINTNPQDASIEATDGVLWCDVIDERYKTAVQAVIATAGFKFKETSEIGDNDTFVRMVYKVGESGSGATYDVSYQDVPITLDSVTINKEGVDIKGSMGILNPLTYGINGFTPSGRVNEGLDKAIGSLGVGYYEADIDNISIDKTGMDIEGKFAFQMPFVMSLFAGSNATLEINTKQEHIVVEVAVSLGEMMEESAGATARIGFRKGRFDEVYVKAELPEPYTVAPPIPIGISGVSGGLKDLSFAGAFPITVILGVSIEDSTGIEFMGYNLLSAEGEIKVSPFSLEGEAEVDMYMMDLAEVACKFVWATWDPEIEKRGIKIDATLHYRCFKGNIYIQYFEGESFLGRGTLAVEVPGCVPIIGGLEIASVMAEITEYSIAGSISVLEISVGVRYYFSNNKVEFLELKEELEKEGNGLIVEYDDNCLIQYGYNFKPIECTRYAAENSQYVTELNLTSNSNAMFVLRMTKEQFESLDENSIKVVRPGTGGVLNIKYMDNKQLLAANGTIKNPVVAKNDIYAIKQVVDNSALGIPDDYMVTIPIAKPEDGQWTIVTNGSMELMPYSTMENPKISEFSASYNSTNKTITANWKLDGEPDKFRFYVVKADEVTEEQINNPASLWGTGSILYGQTVKTKDFANTTGENIKVEDEVIYTKPTADGVQGTFTTKEMNLPTGNYYVYAKADKENCVAFYSVQKISVNNAATPDAPTGLIIKDIGNNQISISWDADYNMNEYYIYRKDTATGSYDLGTPVGVYKVYDPEDYAPDYDKWPGNLPKERLKRFEAVIDGDEIDKAKPVNKTYYFDVRAVGTKRNAVINKLPMAADNLAIPNVTSSSGTIGEPTSGSVVVGVPQEITVATEIKSADSKIILKTYVEKDSNGVEQQRYKYVTNSDKIIISGNSNSNVKYSIEHNGDKVNLSNTGFLKSFSENIKLKEGNNSFVIIYENEHGDREVEDYVVEFDNKAPTLVITEPKEGSVAVNGIITVSGVTDPYAVVSINKVNYDADAEGKFIAQVDFGTAYLSKLLFEVRDAADNLTKTELSILNDMAEIKDITLVPSFKYMGTNTSQKLSTYISKDDVLGEKLPDNLVKYSITNGAKYASIDDKGVLTAMFEGTVVVKSEFYVNDSVSISDSIVIEVTGDKYSGSNSKYIPPVYSKELLIWLAGAAMSTNGGIIKTPDGVILNIPKGALPYYQDNIDIFTFKDVQKLIESLHLPNGVAAVSSPYQIGLVSNFVKPAKLTLPLTGIGNAYVYFYDEETGALIYRGGTMSSDKKTVTADITKPGIYIAINNPSQSVFADIAPDFWGYDYIYALNYLNIINGYNNTFRPNANITRAEFIKLLVMTQNINLSETEGLELKFADNDQIPAWAIPYIKAAYMKGLINGKNIDNKNYIAASEYITREEIAAIIGRSVQSDETSNKKFNDSNKISSWAEKEISKLISKGIISGYEDNTFRPMNNATRVEASVMIYKYLVQFN